MTSPSPAVTALRLLVVDIDAGLHRRLSAAVEREGIAEAEFVTDAIAGLVAVVGGGGAVEASVEAGAPRGILRVRIPQWAMSQADSLVGARPDLADRAAVVRLALLTHLDGLDELGGAIAWLRPQPSGGGSAGIARAEDLDIASNTLRQAYQRARGAGDVRGAETSGALRARSAVTSRLDALVSSKSVGVNTLSLADLMMPRDLSSQPPIDPTEVPVGIDLALADRAMDHDFPSVDRADESRQATISGLTNRITPTLWATGELLEAMAARGWEPLLVGEFLSVVVPKAWRLGAGLERWESEQNLESRLHSRFRSSARWPSAPKSDWADDKAARREASSVYGFIEASLLIPRQGGDILSGAMAILGLAAAVRDEGPGIRLVPTAQAVRLLAQLRAADTSLAYPHSDEAWQAYRAFLEQANPGELKRMLQVLEDIARSSDRDQVNEFAKAWEKPLAGMRHGASTFVNGYIARLREWGLLRVESGFGVGALTARGEREL